MDTTSRLLMLLDVIEHGSFAKAAEFRNIDRSVISKQINKLEDDMAIRLLNRTTRSVSLTAAGAEMIKKARELRDLLGETIRLAENFHLEPRGILKIASASSIAKRFLQPIINDFQKRFPQVEIELLLEDRMVNIVTEGIDLAFRVGDPKDSTLIARKLARNRLVILASPQFIQTYGAPQKMEELSDLPCAAYASNTLRHTSIQYTDANGNIQEQTVKSIFRSNDPEMLLLKAISGNAYVVVPSFIVDQEIKDGLLTTILTNVQLNDYSALYAIYPHRDLPVRTRLFYDAVRQHIGKHTPIWEENIPDFHKLYQGTND